MVKIGLSFINGKLRITLQDRKKNKEIIIEPSLSKIEIDSLNNFFDNELVLLCTEESINSLPDET